MARIHEREEIKKVPQKYHCELKVFIKQDADQLPPHSLHPEDHEMKKQRSAPYARNYKPTGDTQEFNEGTWKVQPF